MCRLQPDLSELKKFYSGDLVFTCIRHTPSIAICVWLLFLSPISGFFKTSNAEDCLQQVGQDAANPSNKSLTAIYRAEELQVPDVSQIDDVELILDQLEKGPRASLHLVTGGIITLDRNEPLKASLVESWNRRFTIVRERDPRVRRLIEIGETARGRVQKRLLAAKPLVASHLALTLRSIGTEQSVSMLVKLLEKLEEARSAQAPESHEIMAMLSTTSALWELTGRKHTFNPEQWLEWWTDVQHDFVLPRRRERTAITRVLSERVKSLVDTLRREEQPASEQLVAMGPAVLSHLMSVLRTEWQSTSKPTDIISDRPFTYRLAWVIDELGGLHELPRELCLEYCTVRQLFNRLDGSPIEELALCRALSHCSFVDFCSLCLDAEKRKQDLNDFPPEWKPWYSAETILFSRHFDQRKPPFISGDPMNFPHWNDVIPASNPTQEIADAVPVLIKGLNDNERTVRNCAARFAGNIGLCSSEQPKELIDALANAWLEEQDPVIRPNIRTALTRFSTSTVLQTILEGLHSDRLDLVNDAAGMMGEVRIRPNTENRADFDRLLELTHHSDDRVRKRAVCSLASIEPKLLALEFSRLAKDENDDIREAVIRSIRNLEDPAHATILFQLAKEAKDQLRIDAVVALGHLKDPAILPRLLPFLKDKKLRGSAVASMVRLGGTESLPHLMSELAADNDIEGMIYQHLRRLTGESFENRPQPWLEWWKHRE